ncbi:hypothetical protein AGR4B_pAt20184 [Agrobacterium tumefaciens str. CFBP 5621]|nr:hypothetical protein AGR4B_pAt20184 [Agrobacterium tumefaciens str. CFBP 5621]
MNSWSDGASLRKRWEETQWDEERLDSLSFPHRFLPRLVVPRRPEMPNFTKYVLYSINVDAVLD